MTMKTYVFEIQALIKVAIDAENLEEARLFVVDNLHSGDYDDRLNMGAIVSNGIQVD